MGSGPPDEVRTAVEAALSREATGSVRVTGSSPVGGGCISPTARLQTEAGPYFLKWGGPDQPAELLAAEARGLQELADTDEVRVPAVIARGVDRDPPWLLLEWLEPGRGRADSWRRLGTELAALHRHGDDRFGADSDNFIGSLPQPNGRTDDWPAFWRAHRLEPQLRQAVDRGLMDDGDLRRFDALFDRLDEILAPGSDEGPSLLHGDLWSGNVHMTDGRAAVIDPSVYHGHREVDLAMAELFGGFEPGFFQAYDHRWPRAPGYAPTRRAVYQLYYLLVHVNLFGSGYVGRTRSALASAGF